MNGFTTTGLLGVLFIGLKLTGYIAWSWWWVLCPFWIGWAILLVLAFGGVALCGLILLGSALADRVRGKRRNSRYRRGR